MPFLLHYLCSEAQAAVKAMATEIVRTLSYSGWNKPVMYGITHSYVHAVLGSRHGLEIVGDAETDDKIVNS